MLFYYYQCDGMQEKVFLRKAKKKCLCEKYENIVLKSNWYEF